MGLIIFYSGLVIACEAQATVERRHDKGVFNPKYSQYFSQMAAKVCTLEHFINYGIHIHFSLVQQGEAENVPLGACMQNKYIIL